MVAIVNAYKILTTKILSSLKKSTKKNLVEKSILMLFKKAVIPRSKVAQYLVGDFQMIHLDFQLRGLSA